MGRCPTPRKGHWPLTRFCVNGDVQRLLGLTQRAKGDGGALPHAPQGPLALDPVWLYRKQGRVGVLVEADVPFHRFCGILIQARKPVPAGG